MPVACVLSIFKLLPITLLQSIIGAIAGFGMLWLTGTIFHAVRKTNGIGEGDLDLLATIGAFTGLLGAWIALFLGSCLGSIVGIVLMMKSNKKQIKIAFGPWLAFGAIIYVFTQDYILMLI